MNYIECKDLSLGYRNQALFKDLSFKAEEGSYICILGANGSGKSSLLRNIIHQKKALKGEFLLPKEITSIGYLQQQGKLSPDFPATVWEIVLSGCCSSKRNLFISNIFHSKANKKLAEHYLEKLEVLNYKKACYKELSGGLQQRVLLARALCTQSKLLCLDEPVSGLDPNAKSIMYREIKNANNEGATILMVSHDLPTVLNDATHVLYIGNKCIFTTTKEFVESKFGQSVIEINRSLNA